MTKTVDEYFEFAMEYRGEEELEDGVIPNCDLGSPCGDGGETACCYRVDMRKDEMYETSFRCMNKVVSHADINFNIDDTIVTVQCMDSASILKAGVALAIAAYTLY